MAEKMTRRTFLKGAAAAAAAVSLSGMLAGCGESGLAHDEVKVGAFTMKVSDVDAKALESVTEEPVYYMEAKARLTFEKTDGGSLVNLPCKGMFTASVDGKDLSTKPNPDSLTMSNFVVLDTFLSKADVSLRFDIAEKETYEKIAQGAVVTLTIKISDREGKLYLVRDGSKFVVVNTDPNAANS